MPALYALRSGAAKAKLESPRIAAIDAGLGWLRKHQDDDGRWDCDQFMKHEDARYKICDGPGNAVHDIGVTGLALLAFLGDGNTTTAGPHADVVAKAARWLAAQQNPKSGLVGTFASHDFIYCHAIATYALCEAGGLSADDALRAVAQKAIDYLEMHRNDHAVWRYQPNDNDNDTSVTAWCISGYLTARRLGFVVEETAFQVTRHWLDQVVDDKGRYGYSKAGESSARKPGDHGSKFPVDKTEALTAAGLLTRLFLGQPTKGDPKTAASAKVLAARLPAWKPDGGTIDFYYWYYGSLAMRQVGGKAWSDWDRAVYAAVVRTQRFDTKQPNLHGSWDPLCAWGEDGGRIYMTALGVLILQAPYRYAPLDG